MHLNEQDVGVCDETIKRGFHGFVAKNKSSALAIGASQYRNSEWKNYDILTAKLKAESFKAAQKPHKTKCTEKVAVFFPGVKRTKFTR